MGVGGGGGRRDEGGGGGERPLDRRFSRENDFDLVLVLTSHSPARTEPANLFRMGRDVAAFPPPRGY